jgi:hypothetical protein
VDFGRYTFNCFGKMVVAVSPATASMVPAVAVAFTAHYVTSAGSLVAATAKEAIGATAALAATSRSRRRCPTGFALVRPLHCSRPTRTSTQH